MKNIPTPPYQIIGIDHVVIRALQADVLIAFYRDAIGCEVIWDRPDIGLTHLKSGNAIIDIMSMNGPMGKEGVCRKDAYGRNMDHLCISISPFNFESLQQHFSGLGVTIQHPVERFGAAGLSFSVYLQDPEGNGIELKASGAK